MPQKPLERVPSEQGYAHYITLRSEQSYVHDQLEGNFVYLRKALLNTKRM